MILVLLDNLLEILILTLRKLPVLRYLGVYNVWSAHAIPTYRVYQLYDIHLLCCNIIQFLRINTLNK